MGGGKRNRLKKALSPTTPSPPHDPDDDELVDDLLAQLDARDTTVQQESAEVLNEIKANQERQGKELRNDSKNRFRAREMRKAAARLARYTPEDEATNERVRMETEEEERTIRGICEAQGLEMHEITPDGHCLFAAVADQLALLSILPQNASTYHVTRRAAADYIEAHPDDFLPFLLSMDGAGSATDTGPRSMRDFQKYCATIRDTGAWGGEPEILAMAQAFNVPIHVVQCGTPPVVVHSPHSPSNTAQSSQTVRISYHRRMYGLGEHYNSLRPKHSHLPGSIRAMLP